MRALTCFGLALTLAAACGSDDLPDESGGRSLPPDAPVAIMVSNEEQDFAGNVVMEFTSVSLIGLDDGGLSLQLTSNSEDGSLVVGLEAALSRSDAKRALAGEGVAPTSGRFVPHGDRVPTPDIDEIALGLQDSMFELTAVSGTTRVTAFGQFSVVCTFRDAGGGIMEDVRWDTEFCRGIRDELNLQPWIAASL